MIFYWTARTLFHFFFGRHYWAARAVKFPRGTPGLLEPVPYILEAPTLQLVFPLFSVANMILIGATGLIARAWQTALYIQLFSS